MLCTLSIMVYCEFWVLWSSTQRLLSFSTSYKSLKCNPLSMFAYFASIMTSIECCGVLGLDVVTQRLSD